MKQLIIILLIILLTGCDTVTNRYKTLEEARRDQLFERGWLPDILPLSSYNIRTSNDLDTNTSEGEFYFLPKDANDLAAKLTPSLPSFPDSTNQQKFQFVSKNLTWNFDCELVKSFCSYKLSSNLTPSSKSS